MLFTYSCCINEILLYIFHFILCSIMESNSRINLVKTLYISRKKGLRFVHQDFPSSYTTLREKSN